MANVVSEPPAEGSESGGYLREVWSELRKTVWPTWPELRQMTGVVIVTVVLLGAFLGLVDFGLTALLAPLYTTNSTPAVTPAPSSTVPVTPAPSAAPSPAASPTTSVTPSAAPTP
ncbi:MAG: preprotein translocase subunit SecE [Candidatus Dormibacteria bacterium]